MQHPAQGIAGVEWRRIFPAFAEGECDVVNDRSGQRDLHVMPSGTFPVVIGIEVSGLWITEVAIVVVAAVHEIHSADERDVVVGSVLVADHHHLLMMAPATTYPIVEQHVAARLVHGPGEHQVLLFRIRRAVGAPHEPVYANASLHQIAEHSGDLGAGPGESLVGVAFEAGQVDRVAGSGRAQCRVQPGEVLGAVDEDLREVAFGPGNAVVATIDRAVMIAPLSRREEPVIDAHVSSWLAAEKPGLDE